MLCISGNRDIFFGGGVSERRQWIEKNIIEQVFNGSVMIEEHKHRDRRPGRMGEQGADLWAMAGLCPSFRPGMSSWR